ncbi:hypothetical protein SARC_03361, partial [Sphaeroforma arctica JP610]
AALTRVILDADAVPKSDAEKQIYDQVEGLLQERELIKQLMDNYEGAAEYIRQAIEDPAFEAQAWEKIIPLCHKLHDVYAFSLKVAEAWPLLIQYLISLDEADMEVVLDENQALAKQLGRIMDFVLSVDEIKMNNPSFQNDLSYYRRTVNKNKGNMCELALKDDVANKMSLFYASPTPFLQTIQNATANLGKTKPMNRITDCFGIISSVCLSMIESPEKIERLEKEQGILLCLRVMVGSIIVYDHSHDLGAFGRKSDIDIKSSVLCLQKYSEMTGNLVNALKFSTKHLSDETTPKAVRSLLGCS